MNVTYYEFHELLVWFQVLFVPPLYTLWRNGHVARISAGIETQQDMSGVLGSLQVPLDNMVVPIISWVGHTVTFSFQIEEGWTRGAPSPCWRTSTTRGERDPSSTTCQTDGACTSGWFHPERCLHGLRDVEDAASPERWSAERWDLIDGS